jgi:uncharacterized protein (TIGR00369 family)
MASSFPVHIPFVEHLGLELTRFEAGEAEIAVTLREELTNSWSVAHGGVTMTLLDVTMAHAARSPEEPGGKPHPGVVTVEMKTTFMRPGLGRLVAEAEVLARTPSLAFCSGAVFDEHNQLVAHATGTFKYMKGLAAGDRKITRSDASD